MGMRLEKKEESTGGSDPATKTRRGKHSHEKKRLPGEKDKTIANLMVRILEREKKGKTGGAAWGKRNVAREGG